MTLSIIGNSILTGSWNLSL